MVVEVLHLKRDAEYAVSLVWGRTGPGDEVILKEQLRARLGGEGVVCGGEGEGHDFWTLLSPSLAPGRYFVTVTVLLLRPRAEGGGGAERDVASSGGDGMGAPHRHAFQVSAATSAVSKAEDWAEGAGCNRPDAGADGSPEAPSARTSALLTADRPDAGADGSPGGCGHVAGAVAGGGLGDDGDGEAVDLSVVLAARNDDHAGQGTFITRLRNSLQVLARHAWRVYIYIYIYI